MDSVRSFRVVRAVAVTYSSYLKVKELLGLQAPLSEGPEHDEMLFIVIHQVYELWFKQVLHEGTFLARALEAKQTPQAQRTLRRILTIMKTVVAQVDVLETMTPLDFNSFRARLDTASGFQSEQFRRVEWMMGHRGMKRVSHLSAEAQADLLRESQKPSLWDAFLRYLAASGYSVPSEALRRDMSQPIEPSPAIQAILLDVYRKDPTTAQTAELLLDLDEGLQEWRYRHVKMVERTIGAKMGTGGSAGAEYLKRTLFHAAFPDLWAVRSAL
ncbi:MAG: tryptophan 2,3-dioxygenase family protein [Myxococcota bacterium]